MSKAKEAAAPQTADNIIVLTKEFSLHRPIPDADGKPVVLVTVEEPRLGHAVVAGRKKGANQQTIALLSQVMGLPEDSVKKMKIVDATRINAWLKSINDGHKVKEDASTGEVTLTLLTPIRDGNKKITEITLREPDLEAGIAVEKWETQHEQLAATIASLSGLTIPIVNQLRFRDLAAIEGWLAPLGDELTSVVDDLGAT